MLQGSFRHLQHPPHTKYRHIFVTLQAFYNPLEDQITAFPFLFLKPGQVTMWFMGVMNGLNHVLNHIILCAEL